ncbi:unnamed protein product [Prorocentrum cordatum]|uniref:C2H2-type domain-containing protein n=1 Tax=Prorocentrum cordatum TaxID=2364126 RepID=A0ABN9TG00_9DINO|nr:unnamed protein product [Polarella glacialis]
MVGPPTEGASNFLRESEGVKLKFACGLCPFRSFSTQALLAAHVSKYHLRKTRVVASGTKQFNDVCALFDNDRLLRTPAGNLLKRSATILRETASPAVHRGQNAIDNGIVLVLDEDGPSYQNKAAVGQNLACRRVGHTYYTRGFADILLQESLRHHGRVRPATLRTCARVVEQGSELSSMLPTRVDHWLKLMEDVFNSAHVEMRSAALMEECHRHEEFPHVSMDATIRILRNVTGQADYRSAQAVRDAAPVPDVDAKRCVLTLAGRAGAALGVFLAKDEGADELAGALAARWSAACRSQTVSIASDQPSRALFRAMRCSCFPNLFILSLDPVHLPITYEETHWRKKTVGSRLLRILMAKFTKVDCTLPAHYWGAPFDGTNAPNLRPIEERARAQILDHSLAKSRAQHVIDHANAELPWKTTHEFIEAIAALSALVPEELARRTHVNNVQLERSSGSLAACTSASATAPLLQGGRQRSGARQIGPGRAMHGGKLALGAASAPVRQWQDTGTKIARRERSRELAAVVHPCLFGCPARDEWTHYADCFPLWSTVYSLIGKRPPPKRFDTLALNAQTDTFGGWSASTRMARSDGFFGTKEKHRMAPKELMYSERLERKVQHQVELIHQDALARTVGKLRKEALAATAPAFSANNGTGRPWAQPKTSRGLRLLLDAGALQAW